jgi:gamma-glutamyltranspeptidase/glutathione hydrolase
MAPAIRLAEEGFPVDPYQAQTIAFAMRRLRAFPEAMRTFFVDGGVPPAPATSTRDADRLVQTDLAQTLRALAADGPAALYQGDIGAQLVDDLQANGGLITREDLASYAVRELSPLRIDYRGFQLLGLSTTSGSMTAFQALNVLNQFDMRSLGAESADSLHVVAEALRRAFLDRFAYLADTERQRVPVQGLLSSDYAAALAGSIALDRAAPEARAGDAWSFESSGGLVSAAAGASTSGGDGCTTHLNVIDADRNMVSCTSTLGELFGSAIVARGTGILLNNGMTWFDPEPGHVNSIEPGKRTLWAPTPTLVVRDGQPVMAMGAPGGRRIISAVVQSLVNVLDHGLSVQSAVTTPRLHCDGELTEIDGRTEPEVVAELERRGHRIKVHEEHASSFRFARPSGIRIDPRTNELTGGVHQFTPAWAMGY